MLGDGIKRLQPYEEEATRWALKRLVAATDLEAGTVLTAELLRAKRTETGITPNQLSEVVGRCLRRPVSADQAVSWDDLSTE